jgi:hypothetical protein
MFHSVDNDDYGYFNNFFFFFNFHVVNEQVESTLSKHTSYAHTHTTLYGICDVSHHRSRRIVMKMMIMMTEVNIPSNGC